MHSLFHTGSNPMPETRWMVGTDADVFVHVKNFHLFPVNLVCRGQGVNEVNLRITCGNHNSGLPTFGNRTPDKICCSFRSSNSHGSSRLADVNLGAPGHQVFWSVLVCHKQTIRRCQRGFKTNFLLPGNFSAICLT